MSIEAAAGCSGRTGHRDDAPQEGYGEPGTRPTLQPMDLDSEPARPATPMRVVGERTRRLCNAHRSGLLPHRSDPFQIRHGRGAQVDAVRSVELRRHRVEHSLDRSRWSVQGVRLLAPTGRSHHELGHRFRTFSAIGKGGIDRKGDVVISAVLLETSNLLLRIRGEPIQNHHRVEAERSEIFDMLIEIRESATHRFGGRRPIGGGPSVVPQGADRGYNDRCARLEAGPRRDEVDVFFGAELGRETGLDDAEIGEGEASLDREAAARAVGDIGVGNSVNEGGRSFRGLDKIRFEGTGEESRRAARGVDIGRPGSASQRTSDRSRSVQIDPSSRHSRGPAHESRLSPTLH